MCLSNTCVYVILPVANNIYIVHYTFQSEKDCDTRKWQQILSSWDHPSLMYSSTTNKMQRYTMVFITINALHVSGGSSVHHQELKTVYTASGICRAVVSELDTHSR